MYIGFAKRFVAYMMDVVILAMINAFLGAVLGSMGSLLGILVFIAYFGYFESSQMQATPGKMAMGIIVVDVNGNRLEMGQALLRAGGHFISALILAIGFIMVAFTEKNQGLHDLIADTFVVDKCYQKTGTHL